MQLLSGLCEGILRGSKANSEKMVKKEEVRHPTHA